MTNTLAYTGKGLEKPIVIRRQGKPEEVIHPYIASPDLVKAVNLAILLKRPLLLMGEPGCGKSKLAQAAAYEIHHKQDPNGEILQDYEELYFEWNIKSTTKAKDGIYEYDAIRRLGDAQILAQGGKLDRETFEKELAKIKYRQLVGLGKAIELSKVKRRRAVLLIDEIDKADIDFPNDLLNELDKGTFTIPETGETFEADPDLKPIIFITSNQEKPLPDAFLRRCLFHYIDPLGEEILKAIIQRRFYSKEAPDMDLIDKAVRQFLDIRKELRAKQMSVGKNVSTSELLDWFEALKYYHKIKEEAGELDDPQNTELKNIIADLDKLGKGVKEIPFQQILFKNWNTLINFQKTDNAR